MPDNFMRIALEAAKASNKDVPIGALVVFDGKVIAQASNSREKNNDIAGHAEINALKAAAAVLNNWRLEECDLYVTLEPCPMCAWAIINARIKNVYFGSYDLNYGAFGSKIELRNLAGSKTKVFGGILEQECDKLLKEYFGNLRK